MKYGNEGKRACVDADVNVVNQGGTTPQGRVVSLGERMCGMPAMRAMSCMRLTH
ncbi:hypothetical protein GCM10017600_22100 [Streptosporangium carneum]|uniref:Uncharacterized protein n=1 Tax=Streptosporangium carneum TaxID=47481 RepID=A0A9W6HYN8_9ACTN|nr:hypothetical protein GCM10017600_22100 [Streptosporangium carneum]